MTTTQTKREVKKQLKKICKGQQIEKIVFSGELATVLMKSHEINGDSFEWVFYISINEGTEEWMTDDEKILLPEKITKTTIKIHQL